MFLGQPFDSRTAKNTTQKGGAFYDKTFSFSFHSPYGLRSERKEISHGLRQSTGCTAPFPSRGTSASKPGSSSPHKALALRGPFFPGMFFGAAFRFPIASLNNKSHPIGWLLLFGDPYGNRTHVTAVKGRCLNRLTNGPGSGDLT